MLQRMGFYFYRRNVRRTKERPNQMSEPSEGDTTTEPQPGWMYPLIFIREGANE